MSGSARSTLEVQTGESAALRQKIALARGIRASVPLMESAVRVSCARQDEISRQLAEYFGYHVTEEASHDEWLLDDTEALGFERHDVVSGVPPTEVFGKPAGEGRALSRW